MLPDAPHDFRKLFGAGVVPPHELVNVGGEQRSRSAELPSRLSLCQVPLSFDGVGMEPIVDKVKKSVLVEHHVVDVDSVVQRVEMSVGSPSIADDVGARGEPRRQDTFQGGAAAIQDHL